MKKKIVLLTGCLLLGLVSGVFAQNPGEFYDPSTGGVPVNFQGKPVVENPTITWSDFDPNGAVTEPQKPVPSLGDSSKMSTIFDPTSGNPIANPFTGEVIIK
jgi:hypothetical protein